MSSFNRPDVGVDVVMVKVVEEPLWRLHNDIDMKLLTLTLSKNMWKFQYSGCRMIWYEVNDSDSVAVKRGDLLLI